VLIALVIRFLPPIQRHVEPALRTGEIRLPARKDPSVPLIVMVCTVILVIITGHNLFYTYVNPWLVQVAGVPSDGVPGALFLYGGAGAIGLIVAGVVTDRFPRAGLMVALALISCVVSVLALVSGSTPLALAAFAVWGATFGGVPSMVQTRMLHGVSPRLRDLSAALITTSFNIGIGGGAFVGGLLLDSSAGIESLPWFDVGLTLLGLVILGAGTVLMSRRQRPSTLVTPPPLSD
jgi:predicted MFS family arabinose efflux permease